MKNTGTTRTDDDFWLNEATIENDICDKNISTQSFLDIIIPQIQNYIPEKGGSILDIGCGIGRLTRPINNYFKTSKVFGIDINQKFIDYAVSMSDTDNDSSSPIYMLADNLSGFENLDAIFSVLVFQHINNEAKAEYIKQASISLRQGGILLFQYVEGTHSSRAMYDAEIVDIRKWCEQANLVVVNESCDRLAPRWTWIEAVNL